MTEETPQMVEVRDNQPPGTREFSATWRGALLAGFVGVCLGILGTLGVQGIVAGASASAADTRLSDAYEACGAPEGTEVSDEGRTLTMNVQGAEDSSGASYDDQSCVLDELGAPSSVVSHMEQTTSMDGRQTEAWDGVSLSWSFHPDRGSDMVVTIDLAS